MNYPVVFRLLLILLVAQSAVATVCLVREVRQSERASAYDPATLVKGIISHTRRGSSLGIWLFPDGHDLLVNSGHFDKVRKMSWQCLPDNELVNHVRSNDYLAITDSVLQPKFPAYLINMTGLRWGASIYRQIAEEHFSLERVIELPGGGRTRLYSTAHRPSTGIQ